MRRSPIVVLLTVLLAGCGGDDESGGPAVDAAGDYTVALTSGANGCGFDTWQEGQTQTNIPFTITQSGSSVNGEVGGLAGGFYDLVLGSRIFQGSASGSHLGMSIHGTRSLQNQGCTYQIVATMAANLDGDYLSGTITYTTATNGSPDCGTLQTCSSVQNFNGTRPPRN